MVISLCFRGCPECRRSVTPTGGITHTRLMNLMQFFGAVPRCRAILRIAVHPSGKPVAAIVARGRVQLPPKALQLGGTARRQPEIAAHSILRLSRESAGQGAGGSLACTSIALQHP